MPQSKKRSRYTPPPQKKAPASPLWMGVAITTLLLTGLVVVVSNYLGLLPGDAENRYLIIGLVLDQHRLHDGHGISLGEFRRAERPGQRPRA